MADSPAAVVPAHPVPPPPLSPPPVAPSAAPAYAVFSDVGVDRFAALADAVARVEELTNDDVRDATVFALTPVPLVRRQVWRVEVPADSPEPAGRHEAEPAVREPSAADEAAEVEPGVDPVATAPHGDAALADVLPQPRSRGFFVH